MIKSEFIGKYNRRKLLVLFGILFSFVLLFGVPGYGKNGSNTLAHGREKLLSKGVEGYPLTKSMRNVVFTNCVHLMGRNIEIFQTDVQASYDSDFSITITLIELGHNKNDFITVLYNATDISKYHILTLIEQNEPIILRKKRMIFG